MGGPYVADALFVITLILVFVKDSAMVKSYVPSQTTDEFTYFSCKFWPTICIVYSFDQCCCCIIVNVVATCKSTVNAMFLRVNNFTVDKK